MTCPTCNDLYPRNDRAISLTIPIRKCLESAQKTQCETCDLLAQILRHFQAIEEETVTIARQGQDETTLSVSILADLDEDDIILDVFVPEGKESGHPLIGSAKHVRIVQPSSIGAEALKKVEEWSADCDEEHGNCVSDMMQLPTRVIDVGLDGETPYLVETDGTREWYATLSYCWGKTPQLKLTKARLQEFKEALPMEELSLVAEDAIKLCQDLCIQYLWIDALCIVQDDDEDWSREAGRMCDIYASSHLTIAAAGSADNTEGIFQDQHFGEDDRIASFSFRGNQVFARFNPFQDHFGHPLGLNFDEQYADRRTEKSWLLRPRELPLVQRAWTVQERILSRRVLYYTREEMWWECDSWWRCECGFADEEKYPSAEKKFSNEEIKNLDEENSLDGEEKYPADDDECSDDLRNMRAVEEANRGAFDWLRDPNRKVPMTLEDAYHKWTMIVSMFSAGDLTFAKDKLPALSGLAQQFKRMLQDRFDFQDAYLAGIWRRNMERQLLWVVALHVPNSKPLCPRQAGAFIPTWSWMSVTGNVHFVSDEEDMNFKPRFRIVEVSTELMSDDWAGRIKGGRLVLEAFVVHGLMLLDGPREPWASTVKISIPGTSSFTMVNKDTSDELDAGPYTCLYAADLGKIDGPIDKADTEVGNMLFLLKASQQVASAYERVGLGLAALPFMTRGLWDNAKREIITIV